MVPCVSVKGFFDFFLKEIDDFDHLPWTTILVTFFDLRDNLSKRCLCDE
jgi:hypothetical protein